MVGYKILKIIRKSFGYLTIGSIALVLLSFFLPSIPLLGAMTIFVALFGLTVLAGNFELNLKK